VSRPRTSWEARAGEVSSPLAGIAEKDPPIVITDEARAESELRLQEATRPYRTTSGGHVRLETLQERNDRYIQSVFRVCGRNVTRTAKVLGIGRATLYRMVERLGLQTPGRAPRKSR